MSFASCLKSLWVLPENVAHSAVPGLQRVGGWKILSLLTSYLPSAGAFRSPWSTSMIVTFPCPHWTTFSTTQATWARWMWSSTLFSALLQWFGSNCHRMIYPTLLWAHGILRAIRQPKRTFSARVICNKCGGHCVYDLSRETNPHQPTLNPRIPPIACSLSIFF